MSKVYFIEGNLGDGKSLISVGKIVDSIYKGRRVATNLDLFPEHMPINKNTRKKFNVIRLPDFPSVDDLWLLGKGYEGKIHPGREGLIVLDECACWLNSREWQSKERLPFIQWFTHARKLRWNVIFLIQSADDIDSSLRRMLMKLRGRCYVNKDFMWLKFLPKFHFCSVRRQVAHGDRPSERWIYRGTHLYDSFDTEQIFDPFYSSGTYSMLSPWHLVGRYQKKVDYVQLIIKVFIFGLSRVVSCLLFETHRQVLTRWGFLNRKKEIRKVREYFYKYSPELKLIYNKGVVNQ